MARTVPTPELEPGLVVAAPVHDRSGRLLVPAGMTLQGKHLRILRAWGVPEVEVASGHGGAASEDGAEDGDPDTSGSELDPGNGEEPDAAGARACPEATADELLAERFRHCDTGQFPMDGIFRIARRVLLEELQRADHRGRR